jgi:cytochrome b561
MDPAGPGADFRCLADDLISGAGRGVTTAAMLARVDGQPRAIEPQHSYNRAETLCVHCSVMKNEVQQYPAAMQFLHWLVAGVVIPAILIGLLLGFGIVADKSALGEALFSIHVLLGVLVIFLMTIRIPTRLLSAKPAIHGSARQRLAAQVVHGVLYVLAPATPIIGYIMLLNYGDRPTVFGLALPDFGLVATTGRPSANADLLYQIHVYAGWKLGVLIALHVAAAVIRSLRSHSSELDGLRRMWPVRGSGSL